MKKIIGLLVLLSASILFARPPITSYLYELDKETGRLVLKKASNKALLPEKENQAVINLDPYQTPTKKQLELLKKGIINRIYKEPENKETKELRLKGISQVREIELLRWAVKCLIENKPLPASVKEYFRMIDDINEKTKVETEILKNPKK